MEHRRSPLAEWRLDVERLPPSGRSAEREATIGPLRLRFTYSAPPSDL